MGGSLLTKIWNLPAKRASTEEFFEIAGQVKLFLIKNTVQRNIVTVPFVKNKESHGDIDLLYSVGPHENIDWCKLFSEFSQYKPHVNGDVISFPVQGIQVDAIRVGECNFRSCLDYFSYEVGNFMGIIANRVGMRYGNNGLRLKVPLSDLAADLPSHEYKEIILTKDTQTIHELLGFDYVKFAGGFDSKKDLFDWIKASKYFCPSYFALSELNHQNRMRNAKRASFAAFLKYVENEPHTNKINRDLLRAEIIKQFDFVNAEIDRIRAEVLLNKERKEKFNGNLVMFIHNHLSGKDLGDFIVSFKKKHEPFEKYVDNSSKESIIEDIKNHGN